jgi:hypothetical protein
MSARCSRRRRGNNCASGLCGVTIVLGAAAAAASDKVTCRGEDGAAVPWWVLYKQPDGVTYAYMDSRTSSASSFAVGLQSDLGATTSAPGRTLAPIFAALRQSGADGSGVAYVAYNDENPNGQTDSVKAHAKGVVGVDAAGACVRLGLPCCGVARVDGSVLCVCADVGFGPVGDVAPRRLLCR